MAKLRKNVRRYSLGYMPRFNASDRNSKSSYTRELGYSLCKRKLFATISRKCKRILSRKCD